MYSCVHSFSTTLITTPGLPNCQQICHTGWRASFQLVNNVFVVSYLSISGKKSPEKYEHDRSYPFKRFFNGFFKPRTYFPEPNHVFLLTKLKQTVTKNNRNLMKMINEEFKSSSLEWESQLAPDVVFVSWYNLRATLVMMLQEQHLHEWRDDSWLAASQISYFFFSVQISRYRWRQMCQQDGLRSRCDVMMMKYVY